MDEENRRGTESHTVEETKEKVLLERLEESTRCREAMKKVAYLRYLDSTDVFTRQSGDVLKEEVTSYLSTFERDQPFYEKVFEHQKPVNGSCRLLIAEILFFLDHLKELRKLPVCLTAPTDQNVRPTANAVPNGWDPGNASWELMFNRLRLWDFAEVETSRAAMQQFPTDAYGGRSNKSSKGPVNFRGNICESLVGEMLSRSSRGEQLLLVCKHQTDLWEMERAMELDGR